MRIERLWVDVTTQVGATWNRLFHLLELRNGNHIWLVQYLFLEVINAQLEFFANAWNHHRIRISGAASRCPIDMFTFDMLVNGVHGADLELTEEEIEVHGIDWDGLTSETLRDSERDNNPGGESATRTSWVGRIGPPDNLNEVVVDSPETIFEDENISHLDDAVSEWLQCEAALPCNCRAAPRRFPRFLPIKF